MVSEGSRSRPSGCAAAPEHERLSNYLRTGQGCLRSLAEARYFAEKTISVTNDSFIWFRDLAYEQLVDIGRDFEESGDKETAKAILLPLAEMGMAIAQYELAMTYARGSEDYGGYPDALYWFRKSAL